MGVIISDEKRLDLAEGFLLGDYRILRSLGHGALGKAFLAEHRFLKKPFLVKILDPDLVNQGDFLLRFESQVALLATLDHPHIVKVHNVSHAQGYYFLVTDPVIGETGEIKNLFDYIREKGGRLPEEETFQIIVQIASALDYCHQQGPAQDKLAHLSLKPSNVLATKNGQGVKVQITDIGLSRIIGPSSYMSRIYRAIADKIGEPIELLPKKELSLLHHYLFLAPEQRWQLKSSFAWAADVYALGLIVYFMITGRYAEAMLDSIETAVPSYQLKWDKFLHACLSTDPIKRPHSLSDVIQELNAHSTSASSIAPAIFKPVLHKGHLQRPQAGDEDRKPLLQFPFKTVISAESSEEDKIEPLLTPMVVIPGGLFERGSNKGARDEMPRHTIQLQPYAMDIHPITNEQFVLFIKAIGGEKDANNNDLIRLRESRIKRVHDQLSIEAGYHHHPVVGVTRYGAMAYAEWIGKRLPTEAEWEIAALGGFANGIYSTGHDIDKTQANFFSSDTTAVMSYPANGYKLYDMAGNVYEWCHDWYDYHYYELAKQEFKNPLGPAQGVYRVLRGGCWKSLKEDLRISHRHRNKPSAAHPTYGIRCAADVSS